MFLHIFYRLKMSNYFLMFFSTESESYVLKLFFSFSDVAKFVTHVFPLKIFFHDTHASSNFFPKIGFLTVKANLNLVRIYNSNFRKF